MLHSSSKTAGGSVRRTLRRAASLLAVTLGVILCSGASGCTGRAEGGAGGEDSSIQNESDPVPADEAATLLSELRRESATAGSDEDLPPSVVSRLGALPVSTLEQVADGLTPNDDFRLAAAVAEQAFAAGRETTALRLLGQRVIVGDDLSGLFFAWLHADEAQLALRRYVGISRYLLDRSPHLSPSQQETADRFLCDDSLGQPLETCTSDAVLRRLEQLERQIASTPPGAKQGDSPK